MAEIKKPARRQFFRRAIKVGNSAGVLLPRAFLGSQVLVRIVNPPLNIKRDTIKLLEPVLEDLLGIFLISTAENTIVAQNNLGNSAEKISKKTEILAVSTLQQTKTIEKGNYKIDIVPLLILKKSIKEKSQTREKIAKAKPILNKRLLLELKKEAGLKP